jgi:hypothetical protein
VALAGAGQAPGPSGEPGVPVRGESLSEPRACTGHTGGRGEPCTGKGLRDADTQSLPSKAALDLVAGPVLVHVDGYRIETFTAAMYYLKHKHGGRCKVDRQPRTGLWVLSRRGVRLAAYRCVVGDAGELELYRERLRSSRKVKAASVGAKRPAARSERPLLDTGAISLHKWGWL